MTTIIMIVDDDRDDMELTRWTLLKTGYDIQVLPVPHGKAAVALLSDSAELPALIFVDLEMLGMNGIDTLSQIRADERLEHIPVVIVTNSILDSERDAAMVAGANGFLHKDFDLDRFGKSIQSQLDRWIQ